MVTFTEAAAAEMRERIRDALEEKLRQEPSNARLQQQLATVAVGLYLYYPCFLLKAPQTVFLLSRSGPRL